MDGYICLQYSVLWGILGLLAMKIGNRLCFTVLHSIPAGFLHITSWILFGILIVDAVGSYAVLHHITKKMPRISAMNDQIDAFTRRLSVRVYRYLERRVERAYPAVQPVSEKKEKTEGTYLQYKKAKLNPSYLQDKNKNKILESIQGIQWKIKSLK